MDQGMTTKVQMPAPSPLELSGSEDLPLPPLSVSITEKKKFLYVSSLKLTLYYN